MQHRHKFIGLAVLGTAAPIALGALITGNAMAADGASDAVVASVSMIAPDPDGEGSIECTVDGIDMSGEAVLVGSSGAFEVAPELALPADGEVFSVSVSGESQVAEGQVFEGQIIEGELVEGELVEVEFVEGEVIEGTVIGQGGAIPIDGEASFEMVPFDFGDIRQGTAEECAALDQPMVQVAEAP